MQNGKNIINTVFAAMVVLTAAMIVTTIVNTWIVKKNMVIPDDIELVQIDTIAGNIADDAPVAVISTDLGDLAAELYPQFAPETVANFTQLAEEGYYDGTFIYEIEKGIHFGGGSVYNDGLLPEGYDKSKEKIGPEISKNLWPVKGAVLSCGLTHGTLWRGQETFSGTRFLVSGAIDYTDEERAQLEEVRSGNRVVDMFLTYGATPNVSQQITIFAQIFDGMDVLDAILSTETAQDSTRPVQDVEIKAVRVCTYGEYKENTES